MGNFVAENVFYHAYYFSMNLNWQLVAVYPCRGQYRPGLERLLDIFQGRLMEL